MKRIVLMVALFMVFLSRGLSQIYSSPNPVIMPGAGPADVLKLDAASALDFKTWTFGSVPDYSKYGIKGQVLTQGSYMNLLVYKYTGQSPDGISYVNPTLEGTANREIIGLLATRSETSNLTGYEMLPVDIHHIDFEEKFDWWNLGMDWRDVGPTWDGRQIGTSLYNWGMVNAIEYYTGAGKMYVSLKDINFDVVVEVSIHGNAVPKELSVPGVGKVYPLQLGYTLPVNLKHTNFRIVDLAPGVTFGPASDVDALNYAGKYTPPKKIALLQPGQQTGFAEVSVPTDGLFYVAATDPSKLPAGWTYEYAKGTDPGREDIFTATVEGETLRHFHYYKITAAPGSMVSFQATDEGPFVVASAIQEEALSPSTYSLQVFSDAGKYPNYALLAAHRGYWADAGVSENTVEACQRALDLGADMLEVDVRLSGDDIPMLLHDPCLHGTTTSIKTKTAAELMALKTYDRFGDETTYYTNSVMQLFTAMAQKAIITLDIKDTGADWDKCFKACLTLVRDNNLLDRVIFKGPTDRTKIETLMHQVHASLDFSTVQYTPVLYGDGYWTACAGSSGNGGGASGASGGGPGTADGTATGGAGASGGQYTESTADCFADFKNAWNLLMKEGKIKAVETHFKVGTDPLLEQSIVKWLQDNGVRVGIFAFTADTPQGVVNTNNNCETTIREYFHDLDYASNQKPEFLNDGRGNLDFIYKSGAPTYIIHDRPDLMLEYLNAAGLRDLNTPVIARVALPDSILLQGKMHRNFDGIGLKINDVKKVEFFTPNPKADGITLNPDLVRIGEELPELTLTPVSTVTYLASGITPATVNAEYYNNRTSLVLKTNPETCESVYGSLTTKLDEKGAPFSSKFQFPNRTLSEWSKEYPGYDIYLNSNYWSTNGITGNQTASERPEFWLPCTDVYGFWVSDGVRLSNIVDEHDPSSRTAHGCAARDGSGNCTEPFDGRFDTFIVYEDGEVEIVSVGKIYNDHYIDTIALKRNSDNKEILHATSGYIVATDGVIIPSEDVTQKFNNDQVEKMRTVMGIKGKEMYILSVQEPQLEVREVAELMVSHYGCTDVIINDSGKSTALITSVGNFPGCQVETAAGIVGCTTLNGLDDDHLEQFYGPQADPVYRNLGTFLAVKAK